MSREFMLPNCFPLEVASWNPENRSAFYGLEICKFFQIQCKKFKNYLGQNYITAPDIQNELVGKEASFLLGKQWSFHWGRGLGVRRSWFPFLVLLLIHNQVQCWTNAHATLASFTHHPNVGIEWFRQVRIKSGFYILQVQRISQL